MAAVAWRNLWRNRRRTWLSVAAIAFAVALLVFAMGQQTGNYAAMVDNATGLLDGHLQVQRRGYHDDPRIEARIGAAAALIASVRALDGVAAATARTSAFVLASGQQRSYGAQLLGVDPIAEQTISKLPRMVHAGRYLERGDEAYAGDLLARNLGVAVGDQLTILGTDVTGGVATLVVTLVGTFSSGLTELDRGVLEVPLVTMSDAFGLVDEVHAIVVRVHSPGQTADVAAALAAIVPDADAVLQWNELIPGLEQGIELDRTFGALMYGLLAMMVTIGICNAFVMTIFERTREFGMLRAMGMRPWAVIGMLQLETGCLALIGCLLGLCLGVTVVVWLAHVGIPLGGAAEALPYFTANRMYPALSGAVIVKPVVLMTACALLAGLLPALRIRRLTPLEALRVR